MISNRHLVLALAAALAFAPSLASTVARAAEARRVDDRGKQASPGHADGQASDDDGAVGKRCKPCNGGAYCCRY